MSCVITVTFLEMWTFRALRFFGHEANNTASGHRLVTPSHRTKSLKYICILFFNYQDKILL